MKLLIALIFALFSFSIFGQKQVLINQRITDSVISYDFISTSVTCIRLEIKPKKKISPLIKYKESILLESSDTLLNAIEIPKKLKLNPKKVLEKISIKSFWDCKKDIVHNHNYLYALPYAKGEKYEVSQSFNGKTSHTSRQSKYAIDFVMPIGTKVYAARSGKVIFTINKFKKSGGKNFANKANKIVVLHDDGTFGAYVHLKFLGILVKKGDIIKKGQHIGYSGNTGFSRGPHLHFVVRKPDDTAVPIQFEGYEGKILKKGNQYKRRK